MGKSHTDPYGRSTLRGNLDKTDIAKNEVAQLGKREQPPCVCGRTTYKLNASLFEVCKGCDEASFTCDCTPLRRADKLLTA